MQVLTISASISRAATPASAQRAFGGLRCQLRRVPDKPRVQHVRVRLENIVQRFQRQPARLDAVVARQNLAQDRPRPRGELRKLRRKLHGLPALALLVGLRRHGRADAGDEHG